MTACLQGVAALLRSCRALQHMDLQGCKSCTKGIFEDVVAAPALLRLDLSWVNDVSFEMFCPAYCLQSAIINNAWHY